MFIGNPDRAEFAALLRAALGVRWLEKKAPRRTKPATTWVKRPTNGHAPS
jgi:hypothetical protein